jgi:uncharacterized protein
MPKAPITPPNAEIVKSFFAATYAGDFERAFRDCAHPDFAWIVGSATNDDLRRAIPWAGHALTGREGYLSMTNTLFSEFESVRFEARRYIDAGDSVFVEGHFTFRHRETGRLADSDWLARFDMKNGRIAGGQFYENTYAVAAARVTP